MKTEKKILKYFIETKTEKTIRELSKEIKSDYKITHTAIKRLIEKNIISSKKVGKSILCGLNNNYNIQIYEVENQRKDELLKNKNLNQLYLEVMNKINSNFFIFLVFGSYANKRQTNKSDIDLIFISNEKNFEKRIGNILELLPIKTHFFVFSEEEFIRMKDSKELNVVKEVINNNIILHGTENYYKLKNA